MTLGELIRQLETIPDRRESYEDDGDAKPGDPVDVRFDFCGMVPTGFASYRGYYDQLAIGFANSDAYPEPKYIKTLAEFRAVAKKANGETFTGWKGGEYRMGPSTKVWVDNPGHCYGTELCGVRFDGYSAMLLTRHEED